MGGEILNSFLNSFNDNYTLQIVDIATASHNYFPKPDGLVATEWAGVTHHAPSSPSAIFSASVPTHIITLNMPNCSSVMGVLGSAVSTSGPNLSLIRLISSSNVDLQQSLITHLVCARNAGVFRPRLNQPLAVSFFQQQTAAITTQRRLQPG
jgi:hypothetical protein